MTNRDGRWSSELTPSITGGLFEGAGTGQTEATSGSFARTPPETSRPWLNKRTAAPGGVSLTRPGRECYKPACSEQPF
jgi:hypothetical protein